MASGIGFQSMGFITYPVSPLLTWPGSTHTEAQVVASGGTIYDTGSGTIGRFTSSTAPAGWTQAGYWQKYNRSGNVDDCGRWGGNAPTTFSNQTCTVRRPNSNNINTYGGPLNCSNFSTQWSHLFTGPYRVYCSDYDTANNPSTYPSNDQGSGFPYTTVTRLEIGCY